MIRVKADRDCPWYVILSLILKETTAQHNSGPFAGSGFMVRKLCRDASYTTKELVPVQLDFPLFWNMNATECDQIVHCFREQYDHSHSLICYQTPLWKRFKVSLLFESCRLGASLLSYNDSDRNDSNDTISLVVYTVCFMNNLSMASGRECEQNFWNRPHFSWKDLLTSLTSSFHQQVYSFVSQVSSNSRQPLLPPPLSKENTNGESVERLSCASLSVT